MIKFVFAIIDRLLFTVALILGMQLPVLMQQYLQRLSGQLDEAQHHLMQFKTIANSVFQGDLKALLAHYLAGEDKVMIQTGQLLANLLTRIEHLQTQVNQLNDPSYYQQLYYFVFNVDKTLLQNVLVDYQLAIPLSINSLTTGAILALIMMLISQLIISGFKQISNKNQRSKLKTHY
jgi:hypothetical protein